MHPENHTFTNHLIHSSSPYLLQHAHNPVEWYPWGEEALRRSSDENKPILLSIGYSSCHWCHVMAHESFEDPQVAQIMNQHFINIKLDREERPDIDQIYMEAVQAMGLHGGWPLNVFLFPDQKPFYGGTYFPKPNWIQLLTSIAQAYRNNNEQLYESAEQFTQSLNANVATAYGIGTDRPTTSVREIHEAIQKMSQRFDRQWGGIKKTPKFPMPSVWQMLLHDAFFFQDEINKQHFFFTLDKIAMGGIYDHIGGGFSRYSVDAEWHVPHFEKMLYDNGQLLSLYANAYKVSRKPMYRAVLMETTHWLQQEMQNANGGFYSALDADSEGVEGKFYTWTHQEISQLAGEDANIILQYYDVHPQGNWEGTNVLRKLAPDDQFCQQQEISGESLEQIIDRFKTNALKQRQNRVRPGLDSKIIAGWNGLALQGLLDAFQATGEPLLQQLAIKNAGFIREHMIEGDRLFHMYLSKTEGFLEDYAAIIQSYITYYETMYDEEYLHIADRLATHVLTEFQNESDPLLYYTSHSSEKLIARRKELFDNVIPASNSIMALNFLRLGTILDKATFKESAYRVIDNTSHLIIREPEYLSNWAISAFLRQHDLAEVAIVGDTFEQLARELNTKFIPNKVLLASTGESKLELLKDRAPTQDKATIFVCYDKTCQLPVHEVFSAVQQLRYKEILE